MANEEKNVRVKLIDVRISFCDALWKPKKYRDQDDSKPRYTSSFLIDPNTDIGKKNIANVKAAQKKVAAIKWKDKVPADLVGDKIPLRDGNLKDYDGYAGMLYVASAAPSNRRPTVLDQRKRPLVEEDGRPYAGCHVNSLVSIWADNRFGNRVCATLEVVQFLRDGDAFAGKPVDIDEYFDDVEDSDTAFDAPESAGSADASSLL